MISIMIGNSDARANSTEKVNLLTFHSHLKTFETLQKFFQTSCDQKFRTDSFLLHLCHMTNDIDKYLMTKEF
jgi:hypothetical protein